jgi:hypothetical protein
VAIKAYRVQMALRVFKVHKGKLVRKDIKAPKALKEIKDIRVSKAQLVHRGHRGQLERREIKGFRA